MKIVVLASASQQQQWLSSIHAKNASFIFIENLSPNYPTGADVFFDLEEDTVAFIKDKPVFKNAVTIPLQALPFNYIRINAWNGFLANETLEVACHLQQLQTVQKTMEAIGKKYLLVPDVVGMIAPRIISGIINEAYFALRDKVSTKAEIDTAMKLGTNYPYGPFEWSEKIGVKKIYALLQLLYKDDEKYAPAPNLMQQAEE